jgi:hypothetical protein
MKTLEGRLQTDTKGREKKVLRTGKVPSFYSISFLFSLEHYPLTFEEVVLSP